MADYWLCGFGTVTCGLSKLYEAVGVFVLAVTAVDGIYVVL